jgi:hypothetical protein
MKPKDIKDFNQLHYDVNAWKDYKWVMVAKRYPSGGWTNWAWTTVDNLVEERKRCKSTLIFHTIGHFIENKKEALQLSDLCFECDVGGKTNFEKRMNFRRMQNTVDALYRFFYGDLGIEDGQIRFFFTGGRSIHIVVMHQAFSVSPMIELNQVMKQIAQYFNLGLLDWDEYHPLDLNVYKNPNMFRMPNSYYPKYASWKIELSPEEISLSEKELRELARDPRPPLYNLKDIPTDPVPEAVEWYQERLREFQERKKEREHIPVNPKALKKLSGIPACIADLRSNGIKISGTRNKATMLDATFCYQTGVSQDEAFAILNEWVQKIPDHLTGCRRGRQREISTRSVLKYIYEHPKDYKFACGYAKALDLECEGEECPLYKKKAFQKWGKHVKVIENFTPQHAGVMASISELRKQIARQVKENGCDFLIHAPPGSGKTETTLTTVDTQGNILYASPRREMLDYPMTLITHSACQLIKPRAPVGDEPEHPDDKILWETQALCKYYKRADALAAKRWNVAKVLCSKKCDVGMARCPYWKQFKVWGSSLVVHQILSIPYHMESLIAKNNPTIVFDDPNPTTLIEQVNITAKVLTEERARRKNPEIVRFLEVIRTVVENHNDETYTTGKAIIQKIVDAYDGDFEKLLDAVVGWLSVPDDYVQIQVDSISAQSTEKAWLVIIDGREHWIARSLCFESDISEKKLMIPFWLADQMGIDYDVAETETETAKALEGEIPLNFLPDLVTVLYDEFQKLKQGFDYNSRLSLIETPLKQKSLRMNLRKHLAIKNCRLILLDAFGDAELLSKLTGRKIKAWASKMAQDVEVIQITDGYYGILTMWKKRYKDEGGGFPKRSLKRLIEAAKNIAEKDPEGTLIVTWKFIHLYLEKLQKEGKFDNRVAVDHFGNVEGTNKYEHLRQVIIIGAPSIQPDELLQMAHCIWHDDDEPLDDTMIKDGNFRPYQYREEETGNGYEVEVREYKDKRLNLLLKTYREYEIAQAAHRIRPLLYPGQKKIWLLTNLPIDELPPTKLTTLDEIIAETNPMFLAFKDEVARVQSEYSGVWREYVKFRMCTVVLESIFYYKDAQAKNPAKETLNRWFHKAVHLLGYESTIVTIGGNVRLKVWHDGNLDEEKIRKLYAEMKREQEKNSVLS